MSPSSPSTQHQPTICLITVPHRAFLSVPPCTETSVYRATLLQYHQRNHLKFEICYFVLIKRASETNQVWPTFSRANRLPSQGLLHYNSFPYPLPQSLLIDTKNLILWSASDCKGWSKEDSPLEVVTVLSWGLLVTQMSKYPATASAHQANSYRFLFAFKSLCNHLNEHV